MIFSLTVLMELIKTEPEVDPLAPENEHRNIEEGNLLSIVSALCMCHAPVILW